MGINRGFLHSLDCADLAAGFAAVVAKREAAAESGDAEAVERARREGVQLLRRREEIFGCTKRVSGSNRLTELKKPIDKQQRLAYKIDPATRYINLPIDLTPLPLAPN